MEGSMAIVGLLVAGVCGSIMLDMIVYEVKMQWWIGMIFYVGMIFGLLFIFFYRMGIL